MRSRGTDWGKDPFSLLHARTSAALTGLEDFTRQTQVFLLRCVQVPSHFHARCASYLGVFVSECGAALQRSDVQTCICTTHGSNNRRTPLRLRGRAGSALHDRSPASPILRWQREVTEKVPQLGHGPSASISIPMHARRRRSHHACAPAYRCQRILAATLQYVSAKMQNAAGGMGEA